jgi:transposase-like protein/DNA-directed RNA polymerase subunit RPC12/RpoP
VVCAKCGGTNHYWKQDKEMYECKSCGFRTSLKRGTIMHKSKLPYRYWLLAFHLVTATKKGFSTKEIQRQLGHKRYQPIWCMVHKIRACMGLRDDSYILCGTLELDEGFFSVEVPKQEKDESKNRGRGSQSKAKVLVMVESEPDHEHPDKGKGRKVGYLKMKVINDLKSETITEHVKQNVSEKSYLDTDDSTSYVDLKHVVAEHHPVKVTDTKQVGKIFPWVHVAIANAKRWLLANHHDIKQEFLQFYLNEFCYKFNRRYFRDTIFDSVILSLTGCLCVQLNIKMNLGIYKDMR